MARRLTGAGYETWGFDVRHRSEFADFQDRMVDTADDFCSRIDVLISVVRDWRQTQDLCFDVQALFAGADYPKTLIVSSTLSPRILDPLTERLPDDVIVVDAPMSGAPYRAENGTLTFMVGGTDAAVAALTPLFKIMGEVVHHLGPSGAGLTCKVVNNFVASSSVVAVRRALSAAQALGVEQKTLLDVMRTSSGGTWFGDNFDDISWSGQGYDPTNTIGILEKDMMSFVDALSDIPEHDAGGFEQTIIDSLRTLSDLAR